MQIYYDVSTKVLTIRAMDGASFSLTKSSTPADIMKALTYFDPDNNATVLMYVVDSKARESNLEVLNYIFELVSTLSEEDRIETLKTIFTQKTRYKSAGVALLGNALMIALQNVNLPAVSLLLLWIGKLPLDIQATILSQDSGLGMTALSYSLVEKDGIFDKKRQKRDTEALKSAQTKLLIQYLQSLSPETLKKILLQITTSGSNILQLTLECLPQLAPDVLLLISQLAEEDQELILSQLNKHSKVELANLVKERVSHVSNPAHQYYMLFDWYGGSKVICDVLGIEKGLIDLSEKFPEALMARAMIAQQCGNEETRAGCVDMLEARSKGTKGFSLFSLFKGSDKEVCNALLSASLMLEDKRGVNPFIREYSQCILAVVGDRAGHSLH